MSIVARPLDNISDAADALIVPLFCHSCGGRGLRQIDQGNGGNRRTWTGRCTCCGAESVVVIELVEIHAGSREYVA